MTDSYWSIWSRTKDVLRFLVNQNSGYHTIMSLSCDFHTYTGTYIPMYELGHPSIESLLQSMPDVLYVSKLNKLVVDALPNILYCSHR